MTDQAWANLIAWLQSKGIALVLPLEGKYRLDRKSARAGMLTWRQQQKLAEHIAEAQARQRGIAA